MPLGTPVEPLVYSKNAGEPVIARFSILLSLRPVISDTLAIFVFELASLEAESRVDWWHSIRLG